MSRLSIKEFKELLKIDNYEVNSDTLKSYIERLYDNIDDHIIILLQDTLVSNKYDASVSKKFDASINDYYGSPILSISLGFGSLDFIITNGILFLIEENFYHRGGICDDTEITIGVPSVENVVKIINLFSNYGRYRDSSNPSMSQLLSNVKML